MPYLWLCTRHSSLFSVSCPFLQGIELTYIPPPEAFVPSCCWFFSFPSFRVSPGTHLTRRRAGVAAPRTARRVRRRVGGFAMSLLRLSFCASAHTLWMDTWTGGGFSTYCPRWGRGGGFDTWVLVCVCGSMFWRGDYCVWLSTYLANLAGHIYCTYHRYLAVLMQA